MPKLRHIAIAAEDPEAMAEFYKRAFDFVEVGRPNGQQGRSRRRDRDLRQVDIGGDARGRAELGQIAGQAIGDVHRRGGKVAHRFGQRVARLRHPVTADQHLPCGRISG